MDTYTMLVCNDFRRIHGIDDPFVREWLDRIKLVDWGEYKLWLYGGILDKGHTRDIDGSITGPWQPEKLRQLLDICYKEAFALRIMPDIKWQKGDVHVTEDYWGAYPPGMMVMNGVRGTAGKLGDGNLRWKETKLRPTKRPPLPVI
jgi:hypothetical protein